jgi:four helix bundle protein
MKENVIKEKSAKFAAQVVNFSRELRKRKVEPVLINQLLRSGTSIGANVEEAMGSISKKEFSAKMSISFKEARETNYWLKLLLETNTIAGEEYKLLTEECNELEKILFSILRTTRMSNE